MNWFMTGRNNAFDWAMYAPPSGNGAAASAAYRVGWLFGIWGFPFNRRRKYWQ